MTGSGSAVFGIFPTLKEAQEQLEGFSPSALCRSGASGGPGVWRFCPQKKNKME